MRVEEEFRHFSMKSLGFDKYKCKKCGSSFWSAVAREYCPDRPCSRYEFLYKSYASVRKYALDEARSEFVRYFRERGHEYVDPYPVVARWRNDLYLTIASIVVFQPMVTDGLVDPPYNPLVIVQPSVRLEDVDNVGLTFGRHMTSFEMGGHHAFNREDKQVYWMRETVEYALEFFSRVVGVPVESIAFKESWWEGGGNAGPALEVLADGLELATLVFMKYKVVDGEYLSNPVHVVDTGYGIERIAWFTQRTPTAYHAVFNRLVDDYEDILGVEELDRDVLTKLVYLSSDSEINSVDELVALMERLGLREHSERAASSIALYTSLDHVKTLLLLLSDGVVPSNTGEGYLARLVLRRLLKTLLKIGVEISSLTDVVLELISRQVTYWRGKYVYSAFSERASYVNEVVSIETRKFVDSITRGMAIVDRVISKGEISDDDLYKIYDSHGVPPEIVVERARERGLSVRVPSDFYSKIARLHSSSTAFAKERERELPSSVAEWASKFERVEALFHREPYKVKHVARVLGAMDKYVVFDSTIFYPKSGGQDSDIGYIVYGGEKYSVVNVYKVGDVIVHELDRSVVARGSDLAEQHIDWSRRYRLMRHHTATHILLGVLRRVLGDHAWQAGAEKTVEKARLDVTHYKTLSSEEVERIEREANEVVDQHIDLAFHYVSKFEAERKYGTRIYQGGAVYSPILRIVEIPGIDVEACFGVHVKNTSEVGGIKIIRVDKIQDGVIRFEYIAGTRLPEYLSSLSAERERIISLVGAAGGDLARSVESILNQLREGQELVRSYRSALRELILREATARATSACGVPIAVIERSVSDQALYKSVLDELSLKNEYLTIMYDESSVEIAINPEVAKRMGVDLRRVIDLLRERHEVKGGGKPDHVTIRVGRPKEKLEDIVKFAKNVICQGSRE